MPTWTLGDVIRRHRKAKGPRWTQAFLGSQCRPPLNKDQVTKAETDKPISDDTLKRIAAALGTTAADLRSEADGGGDGVGVPSVRISRRTRYPQEIPLDNAWTRPPQVAGGEEPGMPSDPHFTSLTQYWQHLTDEQRAEIVALSASLYSRRKSAGKAGG